MTSSIAAMHLKREARVRLGITPTHLAGCFVEEGQCALIGDEFLLRIADVGAFHYKRGSGVTLQKGPGVAHSSVQAYLDGSVYGAIAWINGYIPLHASAVSHAGKVYAFVGESGAGKSTLSAALANSGTPLFADDVMVLDGIRLGKLACLPGHKSLKLCADAFEMVRAARLDRVLPGLDKYFAAVESERDGLARPLAILFFLRNSPTCSIRFVKGSERMRLIAESLYRPEHLRNLNMDSRAVFNLFTKLSESTAIAVFSRPFDRDSFSDGVAVMRDAILLHAQQL